MREAGLEPLPAVEYTYYDQDRTPTRRDFDCGFTRRRGGFMSIRRFTAGSTRSSALPTASPFPSPAACRKLGLKPNRDLWIAGYDNNYYNCPDRMFEETLPLVTADKNNRRLGLALFEQLLRRRERGGDGRAERLLLPQELVFPRSLQQEV